MAAPVRYLSGRQQQQKIGIEGSTQNEKVLEVVGRVGIGTTIFEPDSELEVRGDVIVSGIITAGSIEVSSGEVSFDDVNVSGASTFTGAADFNGDIDVDGHTELDDLNVSGFSTFSNHVTLTDNKHLKFGAGDDLEIYHNSITNESVISESGGGNFLISGTNLHLQSTIGEDYFVGTANGSVELYYDNSKKFETTGIGVTITGETDINGDLNVSGVSTFTGAIDANGNLDVDGHTELDNLNVSGVSTFTGTADFNGDLDVDGHTELDDLNVSGVSTFTGAADFNGNVDIDGHTELDDLNVSGVGTIGGIKFKSIGSDDAEIDLVGSNTLFIRAGGVTSGKVRIQGHTAYDNIICNAVNGPGTTELHFATSGGTGGKKLETLGAGVSVYGTTETQQLTVSGVSTFVGVATFSTNDVYVAQRLFVGGVEVGGSTNTFAGINTFTDTTDNTLGDSNTGAVQINGGLGVDKNVSVGAGLSVGEGITVAGLSTFVGLSTFSNGDVFIAQRLFVGGLEVEGGAGENVFSGISTFTNQTDNVLGNSDTGATHFNGGIGIDKNATVGAGLSVVAGFEVGGVSTFTGNIDANGNLDVDGHTELDDVNVSGAITATTFTGNLAGTVNTTAQPNITSLGTLTGLDVNGHSELDNVNASGISSATAFANFDYLQAPFGSTVNLSVVVGSKDSTHRYNGTGSGSAYIINGVQSPFLTLTPGRTYRFNLSSSDQSSHPFRFYLEADKTTQYTTNVTTASTYTEITITDETPVVLHYQCSAHGYMGNAVQTNSNVVNTNYAATLRDSLTVSGNINANGNIVGDNSTNITGIAGVTASTLSGTLQTAAQTNITSVGTLGSLTVSGDINANGNIVGDNSTNITGIAGVTATSLNITNKLTTTGIGISVANSGLRTAYIEGPEEIWIDPHPAGAGATSGSVRIRGDLYVDGTEFIVDVDKIELGDFNIGIASTVPTNALLDGAGLGIGAESIRKTITWNNATSALMSSENWNLASGKHYEIAGTDVLTSTTLGSGVVNSSLTSVGTLIGLDVNGHTELDNVNVSGVSTFGGNIDLNAALDVSGNITGSGDLTLTDTDAGSAAGPELKLYRNSASPADADYLGQIKFAGESDTGVERNYAKITGKILDASNGTEDGIIEFAHIKAGSQTITGRFRSDSLQLLNGTALSVDGDITATSDINANGNIVGDNSTNISGINQVTATTFSGNATSATTATNLAGGDAGDIPYQSANGTTTFVDASGAGTNQVLLWSGSAPVWANVSAGAGALSGISIQEEGSVVGTSNSITTLNFVGDNVTATASGNNTAIITLSGTPTFSSLNVTGISTIPSVTGPTTFTGGDVNVGTAVTIDPTSGIISATAFYGSGENLTDLINQRIEGLQVLDEGTPVGTGFTFAGLDFVGPGVTVTSTGIGTTATITIPGFAPDAQENLVAGTNAGANLDGTGCCNIFFGKSAGNGATSADGNIVMGCCAASGVLTGGCNISLGVVAGKCLTSGYQNVFIGRQAGQYSTTTGNNVFIGDNTAKRNDGNYNIAFGNSALIGSSTVSNNTGDHNIAMGHYAGLCISSGENNVFLGREAGRYITTGGLNVAIGKGAGKKITSGPDNVFIGQYTGGAGGSAVSGGCNIAIGRAAGNQLTSGCYNVYFGEEAGYQNQIGLHQIFIGCGAGGRNRGDLNIFLGRGAGRGSSTPGNNTGDSNIGIGCGAGFELTTGCYNIFLGNAAGCNATNCNSNTFIGNEAGRCSDGGYNVYFGYRAGKGSATVSDNTGGNNIAMAADAGCGLTSGAGNVFLGVNSGCLTTSGNYNVFLGWNAGNTNTSGCNNIAIGCNVELPSATGNNQLAIGQNTDRWIAGDSSFNVTVSTASTFSSSGINVVGVVTATDFNSTSDARLKTNVQVIPNPLDKIVRIDGVSFNWIKDNKPSMGVIADNIQEVLPELVSDTDPKTVNYNGLIGLLIEVVKDQQTQINSLNERLSQLE